MSQTARICLQCKRPGFDPWVGRIPWRREWLLTPVFLPGDSHGQRSLLGYNPRGRKESDMTEWLTQTHSRPSYQSQHEAHSAVCPEISDFHSPRTGTIQAVEDPDPSHEPRPSQEQPGQELENDTSLFMYGSPRTEPAGKTISTS